MYCIECVQHPDRVRPGTSTKAETDAGANPRWRCAAAILNDMLPSEKDRADDQYGISLRNRHSPRLPRFRCRYPERV